jgi:hypothetical protein
LTNKLNKSLLISLVVTVFLGLRFVTFAWENSSNVLFWDQWDFLDGFFKSDNLLNLFLRQHGPHRQGLGNLMYALVYPLSAWNTHIEGVISSVLIFIAALIWFDTAARVKISMWGRLVIAISILSLAQHEIFTYTSNFAHGPIPALLVSIIANLLTRDMSRVGAFLSLCLITSLAVFTGFALLYAIPATLIIVVIMLKNLKSGRWFGVLCASLPFLAFYLFFEKNYTHNPAVSCYKFPHDRPIEYVEFILNMFGRVLGARMWKGGASEATLAAGLIAGSLTLLTGKEMVSRIRSFTSGQLSHLWPVFFVLSGCFTFCAATAIGRICLGSSAAMASRYFPYLAPLMFVLVSSVEKNFSGRFAQVGLMVLSIGAIGNELRIKTEVTEAIEFSRRKRNLAACYRQTKGDYERCDRELSFTLYPSTNAIKDKLDFLKINKLNMFSEPEINLNLLNGRFGQ